MEDPHEKEPDIEVDERKHSDKPLSRSSQIGRAEQSGGTPESGREPGEEAREGWAKKDESDTPSEWPEPTTDG